MEDIRIDLRPTLTAFFELHPWMMMAIILEVIFGLFVRMMVVEEVVVVAVDLFFVLLGRVDDNDEEEEKS